jgi:polysaccharide biosynthesis transport protein
LGALDLEAKTAHEQLESYLRKYREAAARDTDAAAPVGRIIAAAEPPRSVAFPKPWQTILLATLAAIVASSGVAVASALASGKAHDPASRKTKAAALEAPSVIAFAPGADRASSAEPAPHDPAMGGTAALGAFETSGALVERLARVNARDGAQFVLVARYECAQALAIALETAREPSSLGATALVDLGVTQDWLTDVLDREEIAGAQVVGLADLLAGRATFGEIIRRDLSSTLDIILSGRDLSGAEGLGDIFAALQSAYGRVIAHASDLSAPAARTAMGRADAVVIVSPPAKLERAVRLAHIAAGESHPEFFAFSTRPPQAAFEKAA